MMRLLPYECCWNILHNVRKLFTFILPPLNTNTYARKMANINRAHRRLASVCRSSDGIALCADDYTKQHIIALCPTRTAVVVNWLATILINQLFCSLHASVMPSLRWAKTRLMSECEYSKSFALRRIVMCLSGRARTNSGPIKAGPIAKNPRKNNANSFWHSGTLKVVDAVDAVRRCVIIECAVW